MTLLPAAIYLLCLATSTVCAGLLLRHYLRRRSRLLMWSAACFVFLALNNLAVVADLLLLPDIDLTLLRISLSLIGVTALIYGFVWEAD